MKLYTEEQVRKAISDARFYQEQIMPSEKIFSLFTPIELPSDEEIEEKSKSIWFGSNYWKDGAKWVIDKIKNQQ